MMTFAGTVVWVAALPPRCGDRATTVHRWLADRLAEFFVVLFAAEGKGYYLGSWYLPLERARCGRDRTPVEPASAVHPRRARSS